MEYELQHHGVKGMKWGVRRYQNEDGSLTPAGQKKISKKYEKAVNKTSRSLAKNYDKMYITSYNKAADHMNNGGIDKFNNAQKKKYGEKYADRDGYMDDYQKAFDKVFAKNFNKTLNDFYKNNSDYKKSKDLVTKYNMTKWNDFAKKNEAKVDEVRRAVEKNL